MSVLAAACQCEVLGIPIVRPSVVNPSVLETLIGLCFVLNKALIGPCHVQELHWTISVFPKTFFGLFLTPHKRLILLVK